MTNNQEQINKIKTEFKAFKQEQKNELKNRLHDSQTYDFEKPEIKETYKIQLEQEKTKVKAEIKKVKDPENYQKETTKKNNEKEIQNLQINYYNDLTNLEKQLRKAKRLDKHNLERKTKIKLTKQEIVKYKKLQKITLKNDIKKIELHNPVNKWRELKNTTEIIGKRTYNKSMPILGKIANQKHLVSIRNAFSALMPLIIVASFITIIRSIPISTIAQQVGDDGKPIADGIKRYLYELFPANLDKGLVTINSLTMGLMAIGLSFGIGVNLGQQYGESPAITGIMGFLGFILWVGVDTVNGANYIPVALLGAEGIFGALITSIIMTELYRIFKKYKITFRLPKQVPAAVANSFIAIIPTLIYAILVLCIRYVGGFNLITALKQAFGPIGDALNNQLGLVIVILLINSFFWWLGIHGSAITGIITYPVWYPAIAQNSEWWNGGMIGNVPNMYPEPFYQWTIWIGGAGSVIGLAIASIFFSKSKQNKAMAKATVVPSIFNISEPMMFGYPIVLNIYLFIPFMLAPIALGITSSILVKIFGLAWVVYAPWSLPAPIGAFLAAGNDWKAIVIVLINITLATLIFIPFFKIYDRSLLKEERKNDIKEAEKLGITLRELLVQRAKAKQIKHNKIFKRNKMKE